MITRHFSNLDWMRSYSRASFGNDLIAAVVVTIMLIPQGMAYAMLAGLPPQAGLYGAMLPLLIYAALGSSRTLAVGPVAVVALMTAAAAGQVAVQGTPGYQLAALWIAVLSGVILLLMGLFRLGFIASFLSHPVISGFITAVGVLIAASQLRHLLGNDIRGRTLPEIVPSFFQNLHDIHLPTLTLGLVVLGFLFWSRTGLVGMLRWLGLGKSAAALLAKGALLVAVAGSTTAVWALDLDAAGVRVLGDIPRGLPQFSLPALDLDLMRLLTIPALMIAIVGYVESISIGQTLAAKRRQHLDPDRELIALGAANLGAGVSNAMPVTGGLARSIVNFDAGAETPAAGALTALMIAAALIFLTPLLKYLPGVTLAAFIVLAVAALVDVRALPRTFAYSRADGSAMAVTMLTTLMIGVEEGLLAGVVLSLVLFLYRTSRPHMAVIGQVAGTEHFRNVARHRVATDPQVFAIRVDESLYFPNARALETRILSAVAETPMLRHVVLNCVAVNFIDASALETLQELNTRLRDAGVTFHLSEVKGPVMDRLRRTPFPDALSGDVFLTHFDAMAALSPAVTRACLNAPRGDSARTAADTDDPGIRDQ